jgi:TolB-like protein
MKKILILIFVLVFNFLSYSQSIKIAILDFENTSGIAKYDGLGKAMSSMLITDIESNVSPKRLQLVERAQIQKILKEQNFQSSSAVDKTTTVKAGKILGVKYLLVGDIYILNDVLVINARLTDTETGDIKFSKKQEGKLVGWLNLKTNIAKELATSISMPFTEPTIPDKEVTLATITTFGNAVAAKDTGNINKAEELVDFVKDFNPDFKYLDDLKEDIERIRKELLIVKIKVENVEIKVNDLATDLKILEESVSKAKLFPSANKAIEFLANARIYKINGESKACMESFLKYFQLTKVQYLEPNFEFQELINEKTESSIIETYREIISSSKTDFNDYLNFRLNNRVLNINDLLIFCDKHPNFQISKLDLIKLTIRNDQKTSSEDPFSVDYCEMDLKYKNLQTILDSINNEKIYLDYFLIKQNGENYISEMESNIMLSWSNALQSVVKGFMSGTLTENEIIMMLKGNPYFKKCSENYLRQSIKMVRK